MNVVLSLYLVRTWGASGVIAATVTSYVVFICGPILIDAELLLRKLKLRAKPLEAVPQV